MALTTEITPDTIATALGTDAPPTSSLTANQWTMWIGDALMLIQSRVDQLKADETKVSQAKLDYVIREAVVAHVRNPDNATQVTVAVDDGSSSKLYKSGAGRVQITDDWWNLLNLTPSGGQVFDQDTVPAVSSHQPWCDLLLGGTYCSCGADLTGSFPLWEF